MEMEHLPPAVETRLRGRQLLSDSRLTHGVAFTREERQTFGLVGLLPPAVLTLDEQALRAYAQFSAQEGDLAKNVFLTLLHERVEVLYFRLLRDHLAEMLPIVYTPTVGEAIQHFSGEFRGTRGVYLSVDHPDDIETSLRASDLNPDDIDLIVATDGEAILGIGDWGVGGIAISIGKLSVYTAAGGIDPARTLPVVLDVGTNRQSLREDPFYLGNRHSRVDVPTYDAFVDAYVQATGRLFPDALLHWEDLGAANAHRVLDRYKDERFTFNDDIQGTGAVALAAVLSALDAGGGRLAHQRIVIHGAGTAGIGIAEQLAAAVEEDGAADGHGVIWALSSRGLLCSSIGHLRDFQRPFARPDNEVVAFAKGPRRTHRPRRGGPSGPPHHSHRHLRAAREFHRGGGAHDGGALRATDNHALVEPNFPFGGGPGRPPRLDRRTGPCGIRQSLPARHGREGDLRHRPGEQRARLSRSRPRRHRRPSVADHFGDAPGRRTRRRQGDRRHPSGCPPPPAVRHAPPDVNRSGGSRRPGGRGGRCR